MNNRELGRQNEELAAVYLRERGYDIVEQNYYGPHGEIDIIAREDGYLVFVEVKYRSSYHKGFPQEAVNRIKQKHLRNTARHYLYQKKYGDQIPCRFDVVSILRDEVTLIKDAF